MALIQSRHIDRVNDRLRTRGRNFRKHWKKYAAGAGAAALAAPFAFQRFRGAANALRKGFFNKANRGGGLRKRLDVGGEAAAKAWNRLKNRGIIRRKK